MKNLIKGHILLKNEGQAFTELAIFGSILLFCVAMLIQYGLEANYQQQVQMEAFRKAQKIAFYKDGPGSSTSLVIIKDKPIPDPRDQWGYAERYPIMGSGNVVWNTNLQAEYVKSFSETPKAKDLPTMYFEVDQANKPQEASAIVPGEAKEDKVFGFHTATFKRINCPPEITVVFEDPERTNPEKTEYIEVKVKVEDIKVMRIEGGFGEEVEAVISTDLIMYPYFIYKGMKRRISDADVDGDGKLEQIIAANQLKQLLYVDAHDSVYKNDPGIIEPASPAHIIDTDYTSIAAGDKIDGVELKPEHRQGMLSDFDKTIQHRGSQIVRTEAAGDVTSATKLDVTQTVVHKIRLNNANGVPIEVPAQFTINKGDLYNWK
ncbi:MAG: hypothetical protein WC301_06530 [Candidatus Omnitrophota bacterium]|jgi:hypothetical protein